MADVDLMERARAYLAKCEAAVAGSGGHDQTFRVAQVLVRGFDLSPDHALPLLLEYNRRCVPEWTERELCHKLESADRGGHKDRGYLLGEHRSKPGRSPVQGDNRRCYQAAPPQAAAPAYDPEALQRLAGKWEGVIDTLWLANRSATDPADLDPAGFLKLLYGPEERVLCFDNQMSQGQALWPKDAPPAGGPDGVWFLPQPVDGKRHPNPRTGKPSRRSEESVTAFRYLVLESDDAPAGAWVAVLAQIPLRIEAIYSSGGRSVHALVRVDCPTKVAWDEEKLALEPLIHLLSVAGVDRKVLTAVRLTRLPQCFRGRRRQRLLYVQPRAPLRPLIELPPRRDVEAEWLGRAANGIADSDDTGGAWLKTALSFYAPASERIRAALADLEDG